MRPSSNLDGMYPSPTEITVTTLALVRKALGYSYAWSGNVEQGIVLLSQAPFVNQDLNAYKKLWRSQGRSDLGFLAAQLQERIPAEGQDNPLD